MRYPPKSIERDHSPFTDEEKKAFRWRIEALANGVDRIKRLADPENEPPDGVLRRNRFDLVQQAVALISDVCGDWAKLSELDAPDELAYIALCLRAWQPAIAMHDPNDYIWDDIISEIERLPFGDEPDVLVPAPRSPGSHRQPAKLSFQRLTALQWAAFLKAKKVRPRDYHAQISHAFGADWDAIRKWKKATVQKFGEGFVDGRLSDAADGFGLRFAFPDYLKELYFYGANYRMTAGLSELPLRSFLAAFPGKETI